jgi:hypothetical protein
VTEHLTNHAVIWDKDIGSHSDFEFACGECGKVFGSTKTGGPLPHVRVEQEGSTTRTYCDCGKLLMTVTAPSP